jgi:hypothetical protein
MTSTPQLTTPEGIDGMVAPGQESLVEEFAREQEAEQQPELLAGKFKTVEDLAKSYQELERKLGQRQEPPANDQPETTGYTPEQAVELYGEAPVQALAEKGVDLADVMWKADSGQDISEHYDALAETFGVSRQVVENYVSKAQGGAQEAPAAAGLSDTDAAELKAMVGGDDAFQQLSQWAAQNLQAKELADYNAVVDSGNRQAIEWALKAIQARRAAPDAVVEPKLYGGGNAPAVAKFESQQQVLDAMNKRNERGQRIYDVDEAYRQKVQDLLARSDVF